MAYIGFDTSNYTTSAAIYFPNENRVVQKKQLLPVREGERGLRQSEAVFHHTARLHTLLRELTESEEFTAEAVCASKTPRLAEGSYMPCFLVGHSCADCVSAALRIPLYTSSHQHGHILAALYSADRLDLIGEKFIAFHLSGGTTEALLIKPDEKEIFSCRPIARSLDLKAGQAVDRAGVMMGLRFPCGAELEKLALKSTSQFKIKPTVTNGNCSLSGLENKCRKMLSDGESKEDTARFCIDYISVTLEKMTDFLLEKYGNLPLVYAGGVMSDSIIKNKFVSKYSAVFASPEFSSDNAAGIAIMGYLKNKLQRG